MATLLVSRVCAVTVYRSGALVTREVVVEGPSPSEIRLEGLPLTLDDGSLRVAITPLGSGSSPVPIASDVKVTLAVPPHEPSLAPATATELEQAELEQAQATRATEQLQRSLASLASLEPAMRGPSKPGQPPHPSPVASRLELLEFRRARVERGIAQLAESGERLRLARERLAGVQERMRVASQARNVRTWEVRKAVVIRLESPTTEGQFRLRLDYFVPGARWAPAYTVRLDRSMTTGTLELRAMVGQSTGEDWTNVALTLSTASPQQWTELPELRAQKIGRAQPTPAKTGWRPVPVGASELYADYDRDLASKPHARLAPGRLAEPPVSQGAEPERPEQDEAAPRGHAGPPPPPQSPRLNAAMPARQMPHEVMPMPASKGRASIVGSIVGGAIGGLAAIGSMFEGGGGGGFAPPRDPDLEPELIASRELLDYGRLRMVAGADPRRGGLRRIDVRTLYRQLGSLDGSLAFDVLADALGSASGFEHTPLPARHRLVADVGQAGFDHAYVADAAIDLASDAVFHALAIRVSPIEATPRYVAVPRESLDVFRIVALRNPLNAPVLAGPADIYIAGRFALTSDLETTPIGGRIELGLGVEQAIKIARNVEFGEDSSGLLKRQQALHHIVKIEVGNNLAQPATIEIRERLSTVADDQANDIQIAVREVSPAWTDYEPGPELLGGKRWTIEVPAGETRELAASWVITIPTQHELIGGNRRET